MSKTVTTTGEKVIGVIHNHELWFYCDVGPKNDPANHLTPMLSIATHYDDEVALYDAIAALREFPYNILALKILDVCKCPECGAEYVGPSALSRKDNETKICTKCGIDEAVTAYAKSICK